MSARDIPEAMMWVVLSSTRRRAFRRLILSVKTVNSWVLVQKTASPKFVISVPFAWRSKIKISRLAAAGLPGVAYVTLEGTVSDTKAASGRSTLSQPTKFYGEETI